MSRGILRTSVQAEGFIRPVGLELSQLKIYFWSILDPKIKTKAKIQKYFQHTSPVEYFNRNAYSHLMNKSCHIRNLCEILETNLQKFSSIGMSLRNINYLDGMFKTVLNLNFLFLYLCWGLRHDFSDVCII